MFDFKFVFHFFPLLNLDQWYQSDMFFFFMCMSPMRLGHKELGLEPLDPLQDWHHWPWQTPMVEEKKDEGLGDPINVLLKEALKW